MENICLTVDLWSNRQMRGFIGITGYFILNWQLESVLIVCKRVKGRHTAEKIRQEYEEALAGYDISDKVRNVITDNAANMKKALQFSLPGFPSKAEAKREDSNDEKSDSETDEDEEDALEFPDDNFPTLGHCYAHTIQLVVKDGLSETSQHLKGVVSKASNIVKFVRKYINASDILENEKRLQADNVTRWNSQIVMLRSVLAVSEEKLAQCGAPSQLSTYERKLLKELCSILKPFEEATVMVQREKSVSASLVVPITLGLQHKLEKISSTYNNRMVSCLKSSLDKRLSQYLLDDNYIMSAILDPSLKLRWSKNPEELEEKLLSSARKARIQSPITQQSDSEDSPPQKKTKLDESQLFSFMTPKKNRCRAVSGDAIRQEVTMYLNEPCVESTDVLSYWKENKKYLPMPCNSG